MRNNIRMIGDGVTETKLAFIFVETNFFFAHNFLSSVTCNDSKRHFWNNKCVIAQLQIDHMQLSCSIRFMIYHISFMVYIWIVSSPISVINTIPPYLLFHSNEKCNTRNVYNSISIDVF